MVRNRTFLIGLVMLLAMLLAVGCAPEDGVGGSEGNILGVAHTAEVTTWDPSSSFSTEVTYMGNIYETLIRSNPEGSSEAFTPILATDWAVSEDGLEWTFYLREGVIFHDGSAFDAEAVKKSIERTIEIDEGAAFIWYPVESIEVVDTYEIKFILNTAVPLDRIVSSSNAAWIMSPLAADQEPAWFEEGREAGTGPYMLESYSPGEEVTLVKFDDYWGGWKDNQYTRVVVKIVSDAVVQRQLLEAGDVQIASVVPVEAIPIMEEDPDFKIIRSPSFYNYFGYLNTAKPPLDNVKVRQAISYAIPYEDIIEIAVSGLATPSQGPVPAGMWPWHKDLPKYNYDLAKAKELLLEAGYADGTLGGAKMVLTYASENPAQERFAPLIKEGLEEIGIDLEVRPILFTQQWAFAKETDPTEAQEIFLLLWWPTYADGYDNLSSLFTSDMYAFWNLSYWANETYDSLIEEAYSLCVLDVERSRELYFEAQKLLIDDAVGIFLYDPSDILPMSASIKGEPRNQCYPQVIFFYNLYTD